MDNSSELIAGEVHPSANNAFRWFRFWKAKQSIDDYMILKESLASTALAGNRLAAICLGTLERIEKGQPVSDRYLLGLCWFLKEDLEGR